MEYLKFVLVMLLAAVIAGMLASMVAFAQPVAGALQAPQFIAIGEKPYSD